MDHLGGHYNSTAMPIKVFDFIVEKYKIKSVIDIGCGPAGMTEYSNFKGIYAIGIDGDTSLGQKDHVVFHDYTLGELQLNETFDLAYSTEFLEHVEEKYIPNYMKSFQKAKYVFCTGAPKGQGGHHHVNEQSIDYWIEKFKEYEFTFLSNDLEEIKKYSGDKLITRNGMFFINDKNLVVENNKTPFSMSEEHVKKVINHYANGVGFSVAGFESWK